MIELLERLGIRLTGSSTPDGSYVIDINTSDQWNGVFSKLDKSSELEEIEELSVIDQDVSNIMYQNDDYMLNLIAEFDNDIYKLVIAPISEKEEDKRWNQHQTKLMWEIL